jgi:hypothetical protein
VNFVEETIRGALRPPPDMPAHRWAEDNFVVDGRASSFDGEFTTANYRYVREPIDALADNSIESIVLMTSVQSLKSTIGFIGIAHAAALDPGPALWVAQSKEEGEIIFNDRMVPSFRRTRCVNDLLPVNVRFGIRRRQIDFDTMPLYLAWGGSAKKLQTKPVRWLVLDEPELYPDMVIEAVERTSGFWNSRILYIGNPRMSGGLMDREFRKGHQARWHWPCLKCGHPQAAVWGEKEKAGGIKFTEKSPPVYECENCSHAHPDTAAVHRHMACEGRWIAANPAALTDGPRQKLSFTWNAILKPPRATWRSLVDEWREANDVLARGNIKLLQDFFNKRMGQPFVPGQEFERKKIIAGDYILAETRADGWDYVLMTVDVQHHSFWVLVRGWQRDPLGTRALFYGELPTWGAVREIQQRFGLDQVAQTPDGRRVELSRRVGVDSRYKPDEVRLQCARHGWTALIGDDRQFFRHDDGQGRGGKVMRLYSDVQRIEIGISGVEGQRLHALQFLFAKQTATDLLDNFVSGRIAGWQRAADMPPEYEYQMMGEVRGFVKGKLMWVKVHDNHAWDCEVMQLVLASMAKLVWERLEPRETPK